MNIYYFIEHIGKIEAIKGKGSIYLSKITRAQKARSRFHEP